MDSLSKLSGGFASADSECIAIIEDTNGNIRYFHTVAKEPTESPTELIQEVQKEFPELSIKMIKIFVCCGGIDIAQLENCN